MDTQEIKTNLQEASRILQNAQNNPKKEDVLKALKLLNDVLSNFEGMSS